MHQKNKISIIIPAYNAEKYLIECITSIRQQSMIFDQEIIVIDDGSTDRTAEIAKACGALVLQQNHLGSAAARNFGLNQATGDFICFLDSDDCLSEDALAALRQPFREDPELQLVFAQARDFISAGLSDKERNMLPYRKEPYKGCLPGCALIKEAVFNRIGGFDEDLRTGETVDWQFKVKDAGLKTFCIDQVTLHRRIHPESTGIMLKEQEKIDYLRLIRKRMRQRNEATR